MGLQILEVNMHNKNFISCSSERTFSTNFFDQWNIQSWSYFDNIDIFYS